MGRWASLFWCCRHLEAVLHKVLSHEGFTCGPHRLGHGLVLTETARLYPHVVNKLATVWNDARPLDDYLDALLYADRNGRAGLDFKAAAELADVRNVRVRLLRNARPVS